MPVQREITKLENSNVKLTFTIPNSELVDMYDVSVKDLSKNVQVPGFRKGKVPIAVLERKFGDLLKEDVLNSIISKTVTETFELPEYQGDIRPLAHSDPQVDGEPKLDLSTDLVFSVIYDIPPKVNIEKWDGFEVEVESASVTKDDIQKELDAIADRNSIIIDRDEKAKAVKNNILSINYCELDDAGNEIPSSKREDFSFTLGTRANYFEIDDDIIGMKAGETKDISKKFGDDVDEELRNRTVKVRIKVNSIKEKQIPPIDDELAQDVDEKFKNLKDLKDNIEKNLVRKLDNEVENKKISLLVEKIIENNEVKVPESMVLYALAEKLRNMIGDMNLSDEYLRKFVDGPIAKALKPKTLKELQASLVISDIAEKNNIEVTDEDIEAEMKEAAEETGADIAAVKKFYESSEEKRLLKSTIESKKAAKLIISKNKIKKGKKVSFAEFLEQNK
ncbi:MAG: trigger factor [Termitinemataceae bacterium]|nr:MAG: trigger factor [Termitinemataceae bacterium]